MGVFLWQHVTLVLLQGCLHAYSEGIKDNIRRGINDLLVPDCLFSVGKSLSMSLASMAHIIYNPKVKGLSDDHTEFLEGLLAAQEKQSWHIQNAIAYNYWSCLSELIALF